RFSDAHLIPQGQSDVRRAMLGVDRLSLLLDALAAAYDLLVVECGSADVAGVSRLTRSREFRHQCNENGLLDLRQREDD
ncbi:hypothetical protein, partial [Rhizobium johnstonii]|uniref:hypothetical protein n=1 Tax=Rhizobium johnstonii TaxID=3019933 RepID=UPI003F985EE6